MFDIIAVGSATQDIFMQISNSRIIRLEDKAGEQCYLALEYGAKIHADDVCIRTGGGATNVAVTFARMGLKTAAVCKVGSDNAGRQVLDDLKPDGVDTSLFAYSREHNTGFSVIITGFTGDRTILVHRGASEQLSHSDMPWEQMAQAKWVFLGAMAGPAAALWTAIAQFCGERGVKLAINPGGSQCALGINGLAEVFRNTTALFVNEEEARQITGVPQERGEGDELQMLKALYQAGCRNVIITDGERGAFGHDGKWAFHIPAYKVPKVSQVGAGDAYGAGCVVGLMKGLLLADAMRVGAANAAHVIQQCGAKAGIIKWDAAQKFILEQGDAAEAHPLEA